MHAQGWTAFNSLYLNDLGYQRISFRFLSLWFSSIASDSRTTGAARTRTCYHQTWPNYWTCFVKFQDWRLVSTALFSSNTFRWLSVLCMSFLAFLKLLLRKPFRPFFVLFQRWLRPDTKAKAYPIYPCMNLSSMGHNSTEIRLLASYSVDPVVVVSRPDTLTHDPPHASQVTLAPSAPPPPRVQFNCEFSPRVPECFESYDHEDHDIV